MNTQQFVVLALLSAAEALGSDRKIDLKAMLWQLLSDAKKKGKISRLLPSPDPERLLFKPKNKAVKKVEIYDLDKTKALVRFYGPGRAVGWSWNRYRGVYNSPNASIFVDRLQRAHDPIADMERWVNLDLIPSVEEVGTGGVDGTGDLSESSKEVTAAKRLIQKMGNFALKDFNKYISSLPPQTGPQDSSRFSSVKYEPATENSFGVHGPYVKAQLSLQSSFTWGGGQWADGANYTITITFDFRDNTLSLVVYSGPHVLKSMSQFGKPSEGMKLIKDLLEKAKWGVKMKIPWGALKTVETEKPSEKAWSVVKVGRDGYTTEVRVFTSKESAQQEAELEGDVYIVEGTQMWNEPLGQVEEHDREAKSRYVRGK